NDVTKNIVVLAHGGRGFHPHDDRESKPRQESFGFRDQSEDEGALSGLGCMCGVYPALQAGLSQVGLSARPGDRKMRAALATPRQWWPPRPRRGWGLRGV